MRGDVWPGRGGRRSCAVWEGTASPVGMVGRVPRGKPAAQGPRCGASARDGAAMPQRPNVGPARSQRVERQWCGRRGGKCRALAVRAMWGVNRVSTQLLTGRSLPSPWLRGPRSSPPRGPPDGQAPRLLAGSLVQCHAEDWGAPGGPARRVTCCWGSQEMPVKEPGEPHTGLPSAPCPLPAARGESDQLGCLPCRHLTQLPWAAGPGLLSADTFSFVTVQHKPALNNSKRNHPDLPPEGPFTSGFLP